MQELINVKTLSVVFSEPIEIRELECFRGAIVEKVGIEREWYHNHQNTVGKGQRYHYRYPLVQYKLKHRRPRIVFVEKAIDEARHFFSQSDWQLHMAGREYHSHIHELKAGQAQFGLLLDFRDYRLRRWLALNERNYELFQTLPSLRQQLALLEKVLAGNILAMATGLGYRFSERFQVDITDYFGRRPVTYKGSRLLTFDVAFRANVALPFALSLGKGSSLGFGSLGRLRKEEEERTASTHQESLIGL